MGFGPKAINSADDVYEAAVRAKTTGMAELDVARKEVLLMAFVVDVLNKMVEQTGKEPPGYYRLNYVVGIVSEVVLQGYTGVSLKVPHAFLRDYLFATHAVYKCILMHPESVGVEAGIVDDALESVLDAAQLICEAKTLPVAGEGFEVAVHTAGAAETVPRTHDANDLAWTVQGPLGPVKAGSA